MSAAPDPLQLAHDGWAVFPVRGKVPLTPRGLHDASRDPAQVERWQTEHPGCGWAFPTLQRGVIVIDVDRKNGVDGMEALLQLERELGPVTAEAIVRTPSGGLHLYMRAPTHADDIRSTAGRVAGRRTPGLDLRAGGGYVVAPPSPGYVWTEGSLATACALPDAWVAALRPRAKTEDPLFAEPRKLRHDAPARLLANLRNAPRGTRNVELNKVAFLLGRDVSAGRVTRSAALRGLLWAVDGWPRSERNDRKDVATIEAALSAGVAA